MPLYVALLRGVMPTLVKMPQLVRAFESAGFTNVRTVLSSGNVVFSSPKVSLRTLERRAEAAMLKEISRSFVPIVRPVDRLRQLLATDPYAEARLPRDAKRIVTFLSAAHPRTLALPIEVDGARIIAMDGTEIFSAYTPTPKGPVFMKLLEKTFGKGQTTRTWDTVAKIAR